MFENLSLTSTGKENLEAGIRMIAYLQEEEFLNLCPLQLESFLQRWVRALGTGVVLIGLATM
jgi:hypothetical protein